MNTRVQQRFATFSPELQGITWMLIACFWFAAMASLIRHITTDLHPFVAVFFRNLFSVVCSLPLAYRYGFENMKTQRWSLYAFRTVSGIVGMTVLFYSITLIPLTNTIALTFTVPLLSTLFATMFLGEKMQNHRWVALVTGFVGVLVIIRPGMESFHFASLLVLATTCCWSISNVMVKKLTVTDHPHTIVFLMMLIMTPCSLPAALLYWQTPSWEQLGWLLLLGWVSNMAQFSMTSAYSKTDISIVLPFDFARLVFISIMAYVFFGEIVDSWTVFGALIIFLSGVYVLRKEKRKPVIDPSDNLA